MAGCTSTLTFTPGRATPPGRPSSSTTRRRQSRVELTQHWNFYMQGLGYGHPEWGHGLNHGGLASDTTSCGSTRSRAAPRPLHVQAFVTAELTLPDGARRRGAGCSSSSSSARTPRPASRKFSTSRRERRRPPRTPMEDLTSRVAAYLQHKMPDVLDLTVTSAARIHAAPAARPFASAPLARRRHAAGARPHHPARPGVGPPRSRLRHRVRAYRAFHPIGVRSRSRCSSRPTRSGWTGRSSSWPRSKVHRRLAFAADAYGPHAAKVGHQFFTYLGHIAVQDPRRWASSDPRAGGTGGVLAPRAGGLGKGDRHRRVRPQPVARAAIRWMRRNPPPPPAKVTVVHATTAAATSCSTATATSRRSSIGRCATG